LLSQGGKGGWGEGKELKIREKKSRRVGKNKRNEVYRRE